jgi:hypothetical protein
MEFLLRCAILKFCENKAVAGIETEADSVKHLNTIYLEPHKIEMLNSEPFFYDLQEWRKQRYWNEHCDNIFKAYAPLFTFLFNRFGGTHKLPGQKTFMTLDEFDNLI